MRKVAVCLSGYTRTWRECYQSQLRYFQDFDTDFFLHSWDVSRENPDWQHNDVNFEEVARVYGAKKHIVEPRPDYSDFERRVHNLYDVKTSSANMFYMAHGIFQANRLRELHEEENGFKYSYVVRARYDTYWAGAFRLITPTLETDHRVVYFPDHGNAWGGYNDQVAVAGSGIMTEFSNIITWLPGSVGISYPRNMYVGEVLWKRYLDERSIRGDFRPLMYRIFRPHHVGWAWDSIPVNDVNSRRERIKHRIDRAKDLND